MIPGARPRYLAAMGQELLTVALVTEVFYDDPDGERLRALLGEARARGAELAVLPELPANPWSPAVEVALDADAEPPGGPRHCLQAAAAREAGIALVGGAIVTDPATSRRHNVALLFDAEGSLLTRYAKLHLPEEPGFWETHHYRPGDELPEVATVAGWPVGIQICSDVQRPEGSHLLAAAGAAAILAPRATPAESYDRWRRVMAATAVTAAVYVVSVNRPRAESGVPIGGASVVLAPDGEIVCEATEPLALATLDRDVLERARRDYPGYLPVRAELYARGWQRLAQRRGGG